MNHSVARMYTGGIRSAVPTPSRIELPTISTPSPGAIALSSAPTPNNANPPIRHRFRPHRSVSLLQGIIRIAIVSRNSVITVWTPFTSVFRSLLMSAIITFMFEPAKLQMNWASASGAINRRALRSASPVARPSAGEVLISEPPGQHYRIARWTRGRRPFRRPAHPSQTPLTSTTISRPARAARPPCEARSGRPRRRTGSCGRRRRCRHRPRSIRR